MESHTHDRLRVRRIFMFFKPYLTSRDLSRSIPLEKWCRIVLEFLNWSRERQNQTLFHVFVRATNLKTGVSVWSLFYMAERHFSHLVYHLPLGLLHILHILNMDPRLTTMERFHPSKSPYPLLQMHFPKPFHGIPLSNKAVKINKNYSKIPFQRLPK